jgi:hypothetical protein
MGAGTASQLIPGVRRTNGSSRGTLALLYGRRIWHYSAPPTDCDHKSVLGQTAAPTFAAGRQRMTVPTVYLTDHATHNGRVTVDDAIHS